ncbi:DUF3592 domain-containing protein [Paenibacillus sp. J2TS4]|uniref:DUF3592 domain-containing protein n=1 Tax=Paenibacillus sp. J2TS4 TaxID=2807194 RepID=UPI001BCA67E4|nr:DUF3592 domain-containing protein [Paenibacillus sp. J2TS4]
MRALALHEISVSAVVWIRRFISGVREGMAEIRRRDRLRTDGERPIAEITAVRFLHSWWLGGPEFEVDAVYRAVEGPRTVRGRLVTAPADAPVVGGTVIVRFDPDHPSDVLLDRDPDSFREPGAAERYASPDV